MIERIAEFCIRQRRAVVIAISLLTLSLSWFAMHIEVRTVFEDMLPSRHEYVKTHEKFKDTFGGSNIVTIMVEAKDGDIFQLPVLEKVRSLTLGMREVSAVNPYQITSLASKKLKEVRASTDGIETKPLMWPDLPANAKELAALKESVLRNPLVYGPYVSKDLQATLITVDFIDREIDYGKVFSEIHTLVGKVDDGSVRISVVGDPILYGWVNHYVPETINLVAAALGLTLVMLFILLRTWRGVFLPLLAGAISAIWALGICRLLGIHFEPLVIVVAMLITSRAVSHSVQIVNRFDDELDEISAGHESARHAAKIALADLFRPGMLGIVADACRRQAGPQPDSDVAEVNRTFSCLGVDFDDQRCNFDARAVVIHQKTTRHGTSNKPDATSSEIVGFRCVDGDLKVSLYQHCLQHRSDDRIGNIRIQSQDW